jgi:hypothetical protein
MLIPQEYINKAFQQGCVVDPPQGDESASTSRERVQHPGRVAVTSAPIDAAICVLERLAAATKIIDAGGTPRGQNRIPLTTPDEALTSHFPSRQGVELRVTLPAAGSLTSQRRSTLRKATVREVRCRYFLNVPASDFLDVPASDEVTP